jgi:hypothetical protein
MKALLSIGFSALLLYGVATLGRYPIGAEPVNGVVRLTWRSPGAKVRVCTRLTDAERAKMPVHMRRDAGCNVHILPYRLTARVGDRTVDKLVVPPGIHGDRPLVVQEEFALEPGTYPVQVSFTPDLTGLPEGDADVTAGLERAVRFAVDQPVNVVRGRAALVTLAADGRTPLVK